MDKTASTILENRNFTTPQTKSIGPEPLIPFQTRKRGRPSTKKIIEYEKYVVKRNKKIGKIVPQRGRPLKWTSPTALKKRIVAYFEYCDEKDVPYTMSGLALALEVTRPTLLRYESNEYYGYGDIVGTAKTKIENYMEKRLFEKKQCVGAIFALKNNFPDWIEKQETKVSGPLGGILDQIHATSKKLIGERREEGDK